MFGRRSRPRRKLSCMAAPARRCSDCGFLAKRARLNGNFRVYEGYSEVEKHDRDAPRGGFSFVPGETNAVHPGEFSCYRQVANLPGEIAATLAAGNLPGANDVQRGDEAARRVLYRDRHCPKWIRYQPGLDPVETYRELRTRELEADRRTFEQTLAAFQGEFARREQRLNVRLTITAIIVGFVVGAVQVWAAAMSMTKDSFGIQFGMSVLDTSNKVREVIMFVSPSVSLQWMYLTLAIAASLVYAFKGFSIHGVKAPPENAPRMHQYWFNGVGAVVGWLSGWVVLRRWLSCDGFVCVGEPNGWTILLAVIAFVGVTGYLPTTLIHAIAALRALLDKVFPSPK